MEQKYIKIRSHFSVLLTILITSLVSFILDIDKNIFTNKFWFNCFSDYVISLRHVRFSILAEYWIYANYIKWQYIKTNSNETLVYISETTKKTKFSEFRQENKTKFNIITNVTSYFCMKKKHEARFNKNYETVKSEHISSEKEHRVR